MFTARSVNDLGGHLKLRTTLASILDERAKVIDEFSGSVNPTWRRQPASDGLPPGLRRSLANRPQSPLCLS